MTNQVTDKVFVQGECRSHDVAFLDHITDVYRTAFERAAASVTNADGRSGRVAFKAKRAYDPFRLDPDAEVVTRARDAVTSLGRSPALNVVNGGLDANCLNARGLPTVTLGAGQHGAHTLEEYVDIDEYLDGCRLAVVLATQA